MKKIISIKIKNNISSLFVYCIFKKFKTNLQLIATDAADQENQWRQPFRSELTLRKPTSTITTPAAWHEDNIRTNFSAKGSQKIHVVHPIFFFVIFWLQMNLLKIIFALLPFLTVDLQERPESKKASFLGKVSSLSQVRCHIWIKTVLNLKLGGECQSKWGQRQGGGVQSSKSSEARPVLHLTCHWRPEHRLVKG